jgi:hypothetical protein
MLNRWCLIVMLGLVSASSAAAQDVRAQYSVAVLGGTTQFDASSALRTDFFSSLYGGMEVNYFLRGQLAIGAFLLASRPTSDATMFPLNRFEFNSDTAVYFLPSQQVMLLETGVQALLTVPAGPVRLLGGGGVGMYYIDLDQQRANRPVVPGKEVRDKRAPLLMFSGGIAVPLSGGGGLRFMVRDAIFTGYDREVLSLAEPLISSVQIPHPNPHPPAPKETIHNIRLEAGFTFRPGSAGGGR